MLAVLWLLATADPCLDDADGLVVHFATGSADVSDRGRVDVDEFAGAVGVDVDVCVVGHADDRGADVDNEALSAARAAAVRALLTEAGIDPARIALRADGERAPRVAGVDDDARAENRRVVVTVVPRGVADLVLDLPTQPRDDGANSDDDDDDERRAALAQARRRRAARAAPRTYAQAGAGTVAAGAACGALVGGGVCCVVPFTAAIGADQAASATGEVASEGARRGAGIGALVGSVVGLLALTGVSAVVRELDDGPAAAVGVAGLTVALAAPAAGAAIGAVAGN